MEVREAVLKRRSSYAISSHAINEEELRRLVEAMRLAPSCNNNQPWHAVFVRSEKTLNALKGTLSRGNGWARKSPLMVAICSRAEDDCCLSDSRAYHLFDCGLAVGQMMLAATDMGLVAHPIAGYDPLKAKEILGIPSEYVLIALIILGRPGKDVSGLSEKQLLAEKERPERRPVGENFFCDRWNMSLTLS